MTLFVQDSLMGRAGEEVPTLSTYFNRIFDLTIRDPKDPTIDKLFDEAKEHHVDAPMMDLQFQTLCNRLRLHVTVQDGLRAAREGIGDEQKHITTL